MFAIFQGFREWESYACLKFVERTTEKDYIYIFNNCSGSVSNQAFFVKKPLSLLKPIICLSLDQDET